MSTKHQTPKPSLSALSRESGIPRATLRQWITEGVDVFIPEALLARIERKKHRPAGELAALREEKLKLECQRLRAIILRESEMLMPTPDVLQMGQFIGTSVRLIFREMAGGIVGQLEGRTGGEMHKILKREIDERLQRISQMDFMPDSQLTKRLETKIASFDKNKTPP